MNNVYWKMHMLSVYMYTLYLSENSAALHISGVVFIKGWLVIKRNLLVDENTFIALTAERSSLSKADTAAHQKRFSK